MRWFLASIALSVAACGPPEPRLQQGSTDPPVQVEGKALFAAHCAGCHDGSAEQRAPSPLAMQNMSAATIVFSMTNGKMKDESDALSFEEKLRLATYLGVADESFQPLPGSKCATDTIDLKPIVSRWGFDSQNRGRIPAGASDVRSANVASLELAWVFGLPRTSNARSQPVITEDTLFIAAEGVGVFALDRRSGCTKWYRSTPAAPRTALTLGKVGDRDALFFGDVEGHVTAVDAKSGESIWRVETRVGEHTLLTGAPVQDRDRLIVPLSLSEVPKAADGTHECCRTHGAVMSLDASDGHIVWTTHMTENATPRGTTEDGVRRFGPSGVGVWSTPTIDRARNRIYVGTAQNASAPATSYSDAVLALDRDTGEVVWHYQALAGDTYNGACSQFPKGANCPRRPGPDFDVGASVILTQQADGRDVLIAGQKSGDVFALDPDEEGRLLWQERVGDGSALGGVHWGLASAAGRVFAPIADPEFPRPRYFPKPGLYALSVETGEVLWDHPATRGCETDLRAYFGRDELYPECSFFYGYSAAPTVVNDLVFAPALDGRVRAFDTEDGRLLWQFETARAFPTVNGVEAHGGSIDVAGVQAAGRMIYVQSGYAVFGQLPGNALLGFRLGPEPEDPLTD